jgi:hypothetical protein
LQGNFGYQRNCSLNTLFINGNYFIYVVIGMKTGICSGFINQIDGLVGKVPVVYIFGSQFSGQP